MVLFLIIFYAFTLLISDKKKRVCMFTTCGHFNNEHHFGTFPGGYEGLDCHYVRIIIDFIR